MEGHLLGCLVFFCCFLYFGWAAYAQLCGLVENLRKGPAHAGFAYGFFVSFLVGTSVVSIGALVASVMAGNVAYMIATTEPEVIETTVDKVATRIEERTSVYHTYVDTQKYTLTTFTCKETGDLEFRCGNNAKHQPGDKVRLELYKNNGEVFYKRYEFL